MKRLGQKFLKKKTKGTGHHLGFTFDDVLRMKVAKALMDVGVEIASLHSLFTSIEKEWAGLRAARTQIVGACLVLFVGPLGPNSKTGRVYLTTTQQAVDWLQQKKHTVVVIDVAAMINELEERTGERYL